MVNSVMRWLAGLIIPILATLSSVNQRLPSGPAVIPRGSAMAVGTANSVMAPVAELIIPILSERSSVNQSLPSGPAAIPQRSVLAGWGNSAMVWLVGLIIPI